jgi:hypothetical protein
VNRVPKRIVSSFSAVGEMLPSGLALRMTAAKSRSDIGGRKRLQRRFCPPDRTFVDMRATTGKLPKVDIRLIDGFCGSVDGYAEHKGGMTPA